MIQEFLYRFLERKALVKEEIAKEPPSTYMDVVRLAVRHSNPDQEYDRPDVDRIHEIDDGEYQGTLVFVIGAVGYQPHDYWYVRVWYGSCSGCDTLQDISGYSDDPPTAEQVDQYWSLALHVVQGLRAMADEAA